MRRVAVEVGGHLTRDGLGVGHTDVGDAGLRLGRQGVALQHGHGAQREGLVDVGVTVGLRALHGYKEVAGLHLA